MKKTSIVISVLLALIMIVSIIPVSAITAEAEEIATSGICGENVAWNFDESTGTLTISGTGSMESYYDIENDVMFERPWDNYSDDIRVVVIEDGVISVGDCAFYGYKNLERAEIPASVVVIGKGAFFECEKLTSIIIPEGVTLIDLAAFSGCIGLVSINIPNSIKTVGVGAFSSCPICDVYYNGTVKEWNEINVEEQNDELIYAKIHYGESGTDAYSGYCGENVIWLFDNSTGTLTISGTGEMYNYYYDNSPWNKNSNDIKQIIIENGVTTIGNWAFYNCNSVINSIIGDDVKIIGEYAFPSCYNLTSITIGNSVESISKNAFYYCSSLTNFIVDSNNQFYSSSEDGILFNKDGTILVKYPDGKKETDYIVPEGVKEIGDSAFSQSIYLNKISLPASLMIVGKNALPSCEFISVSDDNECFSNDEYGVLFNKDKTLLIQYPIGRWESPHTYTIPDSVLIIGEWAFAGSWINEVIFGKNVTTIENDAFHNCEGLESVFIGDNVTTIGDRAFRDCSYLKTIELSDSVKTIGEDAFLYCKFTEIYIPASVEEIGQGAFVTDTVNYITVDEANRYYSNDDCGVLFDKDETLLIQYPRNNVRADYVIPDSVETIGYEAFAYCHITNITMGNSVETVENAAFWYCTVVTMTLPQSIKHIGSGAFYCENMTDIYYMSIEKDWKKVYVDSGNNIGIWYATIHYLQCEHLEYEWNTEIEAKCNMTGVEKQICNRCDEVIGTREIPMIDHSYGEWQTTKEPFCESVGEERRYCENCDHCELRDIPALTHDFTDEWFVNNYPTCEEKGEEHRECRICGLWIDFRDVPATGHSFSEWNNDGNTEYRNCDLCGFEENKITTDSGNVEIESEEQPDCNFDAEGIVEDDNRYVLIEEALGGEGEVLKAFDINLKNHDGVHVQPNGTVKVKLPLDWEKDGNYKVYRVNEDGTYVDMNAFRQGSHMIFETDHFSVYVIVEEYNYTFSIQTPSRTEIRNKDGIILHANVDGTAPNGYYVKWESDNGNFDKSADDSNLKIVAKNKGYTTFTAILCDADGNELARDSVELYSKSGFFDKIGGFFRMLFGTTKTYDY